MLLNNLKACAIHLMISCSTYYYTHSYWLNTNSHQKNGVYVVLFMGSILLYFLGGYFFLNRQSTCTKNLLSVACIPILGCLLWLTLILTKGNWAHDDVLSWKTYYIYIGYITPLINNQINNLFHLLLYTVIPGLVLALGIQSE